MQQTFIIDDWKLVVYHDRAYGELYHLATDPHQYHNLWDDPAYAVTRGELLYRYISAEMEKDGVLRTRVAWA
ncbi:MAG TPA: hypothetical protein VGL77_09730 [Armatimonadota bacterium]|jgi:arylsulfatase A-like enzyme